MMEPAPLFLIIFIPVAIAVAIGIRLIAGSMDRERIREYVEGRGGKVIDTTWAPFGPGWLGGGGKERIYKVRYIDRDDNVHDAFARTNMWSGVYFTEDQIVEYAKPPIDEEEVESLEEENRRLHAEVERLKRKERERNSDAIEE
jgi:hypothetical protein